MGVSTPDQQELLAYCLGKCEPARAAEIEAFLAGCPDCGPILEAVPDDDLVRLLRGAGKLPTPDPAARPTLPAPGASNTPAEPVPLEFEQSRYRLIRKLGQGGMGTVYLAEHRLMRRLVAVKVIRAGYLGNPQVVRRFRQEAEAAARLAHPHIVAVYDADEAGGTHFLVMEFVNGESLDHWLAREGPLPWSQACAAVRQAALALQFAHDQGMVHRDVKPHNLMRTVEGTVKILDFGLARVLDDVPRPDGQLTAEGTVLGTADYIAPEQARDSRCADVRADIYSLGCTLYHLLSGQVPFPGGTATDKIIRHATEQPEPLGRSRADLPAGLAAVVETMMAKKPDQRYQTPAEVAQRWSRSRSRTIPVLPPPASRLYRATCPTVRACAEGCAPRCWRQSSSSWVASSRSSSTARGPM